MTVGFLMYSCISHDKDVPAYKWKTHSIFRESKGCMESRLPTLKMEIDEYATDIILRFKEALLPKFPPLDKVSGVYGANRGSKLNVPSTALDPLHAKVVEHNGSKHLVYTNDAIESSNIRKRRKWRDTYASSRPADLDYSSDDDSLDEHPLKTIKLSDILAPLNHPLELVSHPAISKTYTLTVYDRLASDLIDLIEVEQINLNHLNQLLHVLNGEDWFYLLEDHLGLAECESEANKPLKDGESASIENRDELEVPRHERMRIDGSEVNRDDGSKESRIDGSKEIRMDGGPGNRIDDNERGGIRADLALATVDATTRGDGESTKKLASEESSTRDGAEKTVASHHGLENGNHAKKVGASDETTSIKPETSETDEERQRVIARNNTTATNSEPRAIAENASSVAPASDDSDLFFAAPKLFTNYELRNHSQVESDPEMSIIQEDLINYLQVSIQRQHEYIKNLAKIRNGLVHAEKLKLELHKWGKEMHDKQSS